VDAVADERGVRRVVVVEGRGQGRADAGQPERDRCPTVAAAVLAGRAMSCITSSGRRAPTTCDGAWSAARSAPSGAPAATSP
jgi:hypothetical protein